MASLDEQMRSIHQSSSLCAGLLVSYLENVPMCAPSPTPAASVAQHCYKAVSGIAASRSARSAGFPRAHMVRRAANERRCKLRTEAAALLTIAPMEIRANPAHITTISFPRPGTQTTSTVLLTSIAGAQLLPQITSSLVNSLLLNSEAQSASVSLVSPSRTSATSPQIASQSDDKSPFSRTDVAIIVSLTVTIFSFSLLLLAYLHRRRRRSRGTIYKIEPFTTPSPLEPPSFQASTTGTSTQFLHDKDIDVDSVIRIAPPGNISCHRCLAESPTADYSIKSTRASDVESAYKQLEQLSAEVRGLQVRETQAIASLTTGSRANTGNGVGAHPTPSSGGRTERMQAGIASLRGEVEKLKRTSSGRVRRRETRDTTATGASDLPYEMLHELAILRAEIEELLLEQLHPLPSSHIERASGNSFATWGAHASQPSSRFLSVD